MRACARDPAMSWAKKRWSKPMDALMRSITSEGPEVNRPPHCALAGLRVSFGLMA
jgi:hypothetical protein